MDDWNQEDNDVYRLGNLCFVTGSMSNAKQISVRPPITTLPNKNYEAERLSRQEAVLVLNVLLEDLHEPFFAYESLRQELLLRCNAVGPLIII